MLISQVLMVEWSKWSGSKTLCYHSKSYSRFSKLWNMIGFIYICVIYIYVHTYSFQRLNTRQLCVRQVPYFCTSSPEIALRKNNPLNLTMLFGKLGINAFWDPCLDGMDVIFKSLMTYHLIQNKDIFWGKVCEENSLHKTSFLDIEICLTGDFGQLSYQMISESLSAGTCPQNNAFLKFSLPKHSTQR